MKFKKKIIYIIICCNVFASEIGDTISHRCKSITINGRSSSLNKHPDIHFKFSHEPIYSFFSLGIYYKENELISKIGFFNQENENIIYLKSLATNPQYRNKGWATFLLQHFFSLIKSNPKHFNEDSKIIGVDKSKNSSGNASSIYSQGSPQPVNSLYNSVISRFSRRKEILIEMKNINIETGDEQYTFTIELMSEKLPCWYTTFKIHIDRILLRPKTINIELKNEEVESATEVKIKAELINK